MNSFPPKQTHHTYKKIFRDPEVLKEMLDMAKEGYPATYLARVYGTDHTSILYQLKKADIKSSYKVGHHVILETYHIQISHHAFYKTKIRKDVLAFLKNGKLPEEIAKIYGVSIDSFIIYCKKNKIKIKDIYKKAKVSVADDYFTPDGFPRWKEDKIEGKICRGKTKAARELELRLRKEEEVKKHRADLLSY